MTERSDGVAWELEIERYSLSPITRAEWDEIVRAEASLRLRTRDSEIDLLPDGQTRTRQLQRGSVDWTVVAPDGDAETLIVEFARGKLATGGGRWAYDNLREPALAFLEGVARKLQGTLIETYGDDTTVVFDPGYRDTDEEQARIGEALQQAVADGAVAGDVLATAEALLEIGPVLPRILARLGDATTLRLLLAATGGKQEAVAAIRRQSQDQLAADLSRHGLLA